MPRDSLVAHQDDDRKRGTNLLALLSTIIGLKDPDALKIPARRAEYSLTENAHSPFHAEPEQIDQPLQGYCRVSKCLHASDL